MSGGGAWPPVVLGPLEGTSVWPIIANGPGEPFGPFIFGLSRARGPRSRGADSSPRAHARI
jgi:hypothetical protein